MKNIFSLIVLCFFSILLLAQDTTKILPRDSGNVTESPVEMADVMRSNGKIYVVLAVVLVIFAGLILYLVSIDRKVSRIEKDLKKK